MNTDTVEREGEAAVEVPLVPERRPGNSVHWFTLLATMSIAVAVAAFGYANMELLRNLADGGAVNPGSVSLVLIALGLGLVVSGTRRI